MKRKLYHQAVSNVDRKVQAEKRHKIREEYNSLLYQAQMENVDKSVLFRIKAVQEKLKRRPTCGMGGGYMQHKVKGTLNEYIKEKQYHPITLREIETYAGTGEWPKSFQKWKHIYY